MMPASVSRGKRCHPLGLIGRIQTVLRRPGVAVLALVIGAASVGLGSRVWAIAERMATDPLGRRTGTATLMADDQIAQSENLKIWINARMAASPDASGGFSYDGRYASLEPIAIAAPEPGTGLYKRDGLARGHDSYALIKAGLLRFPDGSVDVLWADEPAESDAAAEATGSVGKSVALPGSRTAPSDLWLRIYRPQQAQRNRARQSDQEEGWRYVPASFLPASLTGSGSQPVAVDREARPDAPAASGQAQAVPIHFGTDEIALDAEACARLNQVAEALRQSNRPVLLQVYPGARNDAALRRAWAVRSYLAERGVALARMRITQSIAQSASDPARVDVLSTAG